MRLWRRRSELGNLESELRAARPEAPDHLVQSVSDRLEPGAVPFRRLRVVMVGAFTAILLFGLAAFGGVSYAKEGVLAVVTSNNGGGGITVLNGGDQDDDDDNGGGGDRDDDDDDPDDDQYDDDDDDDRDDDDDGGDGDGDDDDE